MRTLPILLITALLLGSFATSSDARPRPGHRLAQQGQKAKKAKKARNVKQDKLKKKIRRMRAIVLADELDLDEDTAAKLFPILNSYDDDFARLARENVELRATAEAAADDGDDAAAEKAIDDLVANRRARWDLDEARFKEVRKVLTAGQAARILVVLPEIDRKILDGAKRAMKAKARPGKKGAAGKKAAPEDELEDFDE